VADETASLQTETQAKAPATGPRICVIGAGPSGIAAGKNMLAAGLTNLVILDRNPAVGGNWIFSRLSSHSSIYETTHAISSRRLSQYDGYPMPADYPDYPSHEQLLRYFQGYAEHFGVTSYIRFSTEVTGVARAEGGGWHVGSTGPAGPTTERFDYLLVASGHHWDPRLPAYPGQFSGQFLHSHSYKGAGPFAGQRVLVIGGGNTACDISVETARLSARTCISMRRGYYFFPKFMFGRPTDVLYRRARFLPRPILQRLAKACLWMVQGGNERYGLPPPDHQPWEHHPTVNSELLYAIRHGRVHPRPDVVRFEGQQVHFADGTNEAFDVVVAATGYHTSFPFLDRALIDFKDAARVPLHLFVFDPARPDLYFIGLVQPIGCIWPLADLQARLVAAEIQGRWHRPADIEARIRRRYERPYYRWARSPRHAFEVDYHAYRQELAAELAKAG
jgi:hypothetical protein